VNSRPSLSALPTSSESAATVAIVGGGITGVTTALLLQLCGVPTTLYARQLPIDAAARVPLTPEFATVHAAASVLPHSVRSSRVAAWMGTSQRCFQAMAFSADAGVRTQTHYEVFERTTVDEPIYADAVHGFEMLQGTATAALRVPRRPSAATISGWSFDAYFCEAPRYLRYLYAFLEAAGGRVVRTADVDIDGRLVEYLGLGHDVIVNCTGLGSSELLSPDALVGVRDVPGSEDLEPLADPWEPRIVRGHYLRAAVKQAIVDERGRFFSYNYTPVTDAYPAGGKPADVYCYPRSDSWVVGGSRQTLVVEDGVKRWIGSEPSLADEQFTLPDGTTVAVPAPILTLNSQLIDTMTQGAVSFERMLHDAPESITAGIGYRFERSHPEESVRLGWSRVRWEDRDAHVIHNYGHGGAGYTLSWGCAGDVLALVRRLDHGDRLREPPALPPHLADTASMLIKAL